MIFWGVKIRSGPDCRMAGVSLGGPYVIGRGVTRRVKAGVKVASSKGTTGTMASWQGFYKKILKRKA